MTITISNIDEITSQKLSDQASEKGLKVEEYILELIQNEIEISKTRDTAGRYHDLDFLAGTWSKEEAERFLHQIVDQRTIDQSLWR